MKKPFKSDKVIQEHISEIDFKTYLVGFDIDDKNEISYRWKPFINILQSVIPEFAFGFHEGMTTDNTELIDKIVEASKAIYKISHFEEVKKIYVDKDSEIEDDDIEKKYLKRGEFGELILHLLLRDFHNTIPLLSKIHFKDSDGHTVHGFDAVHFEPEKKSLWLGESKLYTDGKNGVSALIKDIEEHFRLDYLDREFVLISKKLKVDEKLDEYIKNKNEIIAMINKNTKLIDILKQINIPLVCTYTSENFTNFSDETLKEFIEAYEKEVKELKTHFDSNNNHPLKTRLNIILLLFPVKCKKELIKKLHKRLDKMQRLQDDE